MSATIRIPSRIALTILLARVPLAAGLLYSGDPSLAVAVLIASELLLVVTITSSRLCPRPVSR